MTPIAEPPDDPTLPARYDEHAEAAPGEAELAWYDAWLPRDRGSVLEVGCGVGAQTEILLRHFPLLHVTGVDRNAANLQQAGEHLRRCAIGKGRFTAQEAAAETLPFAVDTFDGAFLCWILEHVADPARTLAEVRRVLRAGSPVVVTEVMNAAFFLDPYSPNTLR